MKNEQNTGKKKIPFLATLIVVSVLAVASAVSFLVSGDVTILRDSLVATFGIGSFSACAQAGSLLVNNIRNKSSNSRSRSKTRSRTRNRSQDLTENMAPLNEEVNDLYYEDTNAFEATNTVKTNERKNSR